MTNLEIIEKINNAHIACFAYNVRNHVEVCYRASKKNIITIKDGEITWIGSCSAGVTAIKEVLSL